MNSTLSDREAYLIYKKIYKGDPSTLTDYEVIEGYKYFVELAARMWSLGPVFRLAASELDRTYRELQRFGQERGILK